MDQGSDRGLCYSTIRPRVELAFPKGSMFLDVTRPSYLAEDLCVRISRRATNSHDLHLAPLHRDLFHYLK